MEKFGIFELLDALSALTAADSAHSDENSQQKTESFSPPDKEDAAFFPPTYGGYSPERDAALRAAQSEVQPQLQDSQKEQDALSSLLARQEEISRRIDKRR